MKTNGCFLLSIILFVTFLMSCEKELGEYPYAESPHIEFVSLEFVEDDRNGFQDSLILKINIWDKEGDLGLDSDEYESPYHRYDIIVDSQDKIVTYGANEVHLPFFKYNPFDRLLSTDTFSHTDNRPAFSCENYDTLRLSEDKRSFISQGSVGNIPEFKSDTVYLSRNENENNMFVDYYIDFLGTGQAELFQWEYATSEYGCGQNFMGRFLLEGDLRYRGGPFKASRIPGHHGYELTYCMISLGFKHLISDRPLQLKVKIKDRELNDSNVIETPIVTLEQITAKKQ